MNKLVSFLLFAVLLLVSVIGQSQTLRSAQQTNPSAKYTFPDIHPQVAGLINAKAEPEGVVFDIETLDPNALEHLTAYVVKQVRLVKEVYPDVDVAIVSHGSEEFALQKSAKADNLGLHSVFKQLVAAEQVSVHVCGAVGGLKQLSQEDFPDFVSYSASGMAQINDYKSLGYAVVVIEQLNAEQRKQLFEHPEKYIEKQPQVF